MHSADTAFLFVVSGVKQNEKAVFSSSLPSDNRAPRAGHRPTLRLSERKKVERPEDRSTV